MTQKILNNSSIEQSLNRLKPLIKRLKLAKEDAQRLKILEQEKEVANFLNKQPVLTKAILQFNEFERYILYSILALDQGDLVFQDIDRCSELETDIKNLLKKLEPVQKFYDSIGGIIGYHAAVLQLIVEKAQGEVSEKVFQGKENFLKPPGHDLSKNTSFIRKAIKAFLENMPEFSEIFPVGGAGDRLDLHDELTKESLPAAELRYEGRTLLEGLMRDLQAYEYLYFKLFGHQITVPIAMMISEEKNNLNHIFSICEKNHWFGRSKESYDFFKQPLVPLLTEQGDWAVNKSMDLLLKPGGHGVLWKLALDSGIIDRLLRKGCKKSLIRQINNPISGIDYGLLAFCGIGFLNNQVFGFASCPRLLNTAEGVDVLFEKGVKGGYEYSISNIEYPDFAKKHIQDVPEEPESPFSLFPANTNILFIDLKSIRSLVEKCPVPGMLINMKTKVVCLSRDGKKQEVYAGRLESLMQNIADVLVKCFPNKQEPIKPESLPTFLAYNERKKTISVTKKLHTLGQPILETPNGCYYDQLYNHHMLFTQECCMKLPEFISEEEYIHKGPNFITAFHPALGPLFSIIKQKIQGGVMYAGSELVLEIAEAEINNIELDGSLLIEAENIMGHKDDQGIIHYSEHVGRCILKNVKIQNRGIDREQNNVFWKRQIFRHESLKITLKGRSEFIAENVIFHGSMNIEVPDGYQIVARQFNGQLTFDQKPLTSKQYKKYTFDEQNNICVENP